MRSIVRRLSLLLLPLIFPSIGHAQKGLKKEAAAIIFKTAFHEISDIAPKQYLVSIYTGQLKGFQFEDMVFFNPARYLEAQTEKGEPALPPFVSSRFYLGEAEVETRTIRPEDQQGYLEIGVLEEDFLSDTTAKTFVLPQERIEQYFQPFFFRKYEVTNAEYREFVNAVRRLGSESLEYAYLGPDEQKRTIAIYPDTACWTKDWPYSYNKPMTENYFRYAAFDDYPVVGVNYFQALAFCHWKEQQLNEQLSGRAQVKVHLPSDIHWEWMATQMCPECPASGHLADESWIADLAVDATLLRNPFWEQEARPFRHQSDFEVDGFPYTHPASLSNEKAIRQRIAPEKRENAWRLLSTNLDAAGVSGMGDNVSEWMQETYQGHWLPAFSRRLKKLAQWGKPEFALIAQQERYWDSFCDQDGVLVRGANWADERYSNIEGKNREGIQAKIFLSPERAHSTVGFRYVVSFVD